MHRCSAEDILWLKLLPIETTDIFLWDLLDFCAEALIVVRHMPHVHRKLFIRSFVPHFKPFVERPQDLKRNYSTFYGVVLLQGGRNRREEVSGCWSHPQGEDKPHTT
jgi:hypothetical protein